MDITVTAKTGNGESSKSPLILQPDTRHEKRRPCHSIPPSRNRFRQRSSHYSELVSLVIYANLKYVHSIWVRLSTQAKHEKVSFDSIAHYCNECVSRYTHSNITLKVSSSHKLPQWNSRAIHSSLSIWRLRMQRSRGHYSGTVEKAFCETEFQIGVNMNTCIICGSDKLFITDLMTIDFVPKKMYTMCYYSTRLLLDSWPWY